MFKSFGNKDVWGCGYAVADCPTQLTFISMIFYLSLSQKKIVMHMFGFERTLVELSDDHILCAWEISKRSKLSIP